MVMQDTDGTTVTPIDSRTAWDQLWYSHNKQAPCDECELSVLTAIRDEVEARYKPILAALEQLARGGYIEEAHAALMDFYQP